MTDTVMLRDCIAQSGLKMQFIAEKLGISRNALLKKIENETQFKSQEIQQMCEILSISSLEVKEQIFFASKVDK